MPAVERMIPTSHADIAVAETSGSGLPVVMIHGNSSCKEVFKNQLTSPVGESNRLIALDLPGHGRSSDAFDPVRSYSMPAYAELVVELLDIMKIKEAVVYGWSLGGHIGLEMIPRYPGLVGLMIGGTPPVSPTPEAIQAGFQANPVVGLVGKEVLSEEELAFFVNEIYGPFANATLRHAAKRTDGRARRMMFERLLSGGVSDQKALAEHSPVPLAIVDGADDPLVNVGYIGSLAYDNLWESHCFALRGLGHAPFLAGPAAFNSIFARFVKDMSTMRNPRQRQRGGAKVVAA